MIANYVNEQHITWDQILRQFAYAIRTAVNETTGKTPAELFLDRKLITPFQKLVMVSGGTEFAVGDMRDCLRSLDKTQKLSMKKRGKYYNRRRHDVQIKVNDWVLVATHPLSSATRKVVAKFKPKSEDPYRVLDLKNNNVRIYRHRKCDETEIETGSSDNGSLCDESSGFDRVQRRSNESRDGKKKGSEVKNDQFDPEKAEKGTIAPTSKNERDQATRMPDEEVINNGNTRKGEERVQKSLCPWRSCVLTPISPLKPTPVASQSQEPSQDAIYDSLPPMEQSLVPESHLKDLLPVEQSRVSSHL
ncbi:uncharacterized protein TNCV_2753571 [Trichonephila clavipes]|nr:uncharacterized protein TNCV_2753571 [Trichonephila clavipes]